MSDYPRPAGLDAFARCPTPGCITDVYAPFLIPMRCAPHGGQPDLPQRRSEDEYGNPRASAASSPPRLAPSLETL